MASVNTNTPCHCSCGYRCGGPGVCKLDPFECLRQPEGHFVKDCDHDFSIWRTAEKDDEWGGTMVCSKCGMTAIGHDSLCGP